MKSKTALFGILAAITLSASAYAGKSDNFALWTCSNDTETRTLSVGDKDEGGCELHYEKNGAMKVLSWSSHSIEPCIKSRDKLVGELKKAGWKCTKSS